MAIFLKFSFRIYKAPPTISGKTAGVLGISNKGPAFYSDRSGRSIIPLFGRKINASPKKLTQNCIFSHWGSSGKKAESIHPRVWKTMWIMCKTEKMFDYS
jgi:hypothetical protein